MINDKWKSRFLWEVETDGSIFERAQSLEKALRTPAGITGVEYNELRSLRRALRTHGRGAAVHTVVHHPAAKLGI